MVIHIWLHNQLTTAVELISSNGLLLAYLVEAERVCDDDVAAFLLVPHADEKFTDVAPAVYGVASSCVEDLAFPGEGGVESPCRRLVKSYTLAGVQHMCGTSNPPPSASRAVAAFQPQCADPLAAVFLRRLYKRDPPVDKAGSRECHGCQPPTVSESAPAPRAHRTTS